MLAIRVSTLLTCLLLGRLVLAGDPEEHHFELSGALSAAGSSTFTVRYTNESASFATSACSYSLEHDPAQLAVVDTQIAAELLALDPDFVETATWDNGVTFGLLVDFTLTTALLPSVTPYTLEEVTYQPDLAAGETTTVCFNGALGDPYPVEFVVVNTLAETLALPPACFTFEMPVAGTFVRADLDGSGTVDSLDSDDAFAYLFPLSAPTPFETPTTCDGALDDDVCDCNDNEFLTIADWLLLRDALLTPTSLMIPAPNDCGSDPTPDPDDFVTTDSDYRLAIGDPVVFGEPTEVRQVLFPIELDYPGTAPGVRALTLALSFDPALLSVPSTSAWIGQGQGVVEQYDDVLVLTRYADPGSLLSESPATLMLELAPFAVFPPLDWEPDVTVVTPSGREARFRTTVVDIDYRDHYPERVVGDYEFVRGNANGDTAADIGDAIFVLEYLFGSLVEPYCFDAADINNDSGIDISDPIYLLSFLFAGGSAIPAPYPQCGFDDGQIDILGCAPPGDACD